jgi:hypothetical protein
LFSSRMILALLTIMGPASVALLSVFVICSIPFVLLQIEHLQFWELWSFVQAAWISLSLFQSVALNFGMKPTVCCAILSIALECLSWRLWFVGSVSGSFSLSVGCKICAFWVLLLSSPVTFCNRPWVMPLHRAHVSSQTELMYLCARLGLSSTASTDCFIYIKTDWWTIVLYIDRLYALPRCYFMHSHIRVLFKSTPLCP